LPIRIYSQVRLGVKPEINAVCTIMIAVVAVAIIGASLLTRRSDVVPAVARKAGPPDHSAG
jgi:putrescine transport system permease protein